MHWKIKEMILSYKAIAVERNLINEEHLKVKEGNLGFIEVGQLESSVSLTES